MESLVSRMVQADPDSRPTADEAVSELEQILSKTSALKLRERCVLRRDGVALNMLKNLHYLSFRALPNMLARRVALPRPKREQ